MKLNKEQRQQTICAAETNLPERKTELLLNNNEVPPKEKPTERVATPMLNVKIVNGQKKWEIDGLSKL